jgi:hypothetical protein
MRYSARSALQKEALRMMQLVKDCLRIFGVEVVGMRVRASPPAPQHAYLPVENLIHGLKMQRPLQ